MKRKVILMGGKTHVISLPLKWIKKYQIKKGAELNLTEKQNSILVSTESKPQLKQIKLNLTNADSSTIIRNIVCCYQKGYNLLELSYNKKTTSHKTGQPGKTTNLIEETCDQLIGFEITEQKETYCHIRDLTENSINEFNRILRRTFLMLNTLGEETTLYLEGKETEDLYKKHLNIRKFINYCRRYLNIHGFEDKTHLYHELLLSLEDISRTYRLVTKKHKPTKNKEIIEIFKQTTELQERFYKLFYKYKIEEVSDIIKQRLEIFNKINNIKSHERDDGALLHRIPNILNRILTLMNTTISINFEDGKPAP